MSTLQVTTITTVDNTTPLILQTGNTGGGQIVLQAANADIQMLGDFKFINTSFSGNLSFSNSVGIGTTNPVTRLHISDGNTNISSALYTSDFQTISGQNTAPGFNIIAAGPGSAIRGVFKATRSRGTLESPTVPLINDNVFSLLGTIYDGVVGRATAAVNMDVDGTVSENVAPQRISFWTGLTTTRTEKMRIDANGNVGIGTTAPGLYAGYTSLSINNVTNGGLIDLLTNGTRHLTLFAGGSTSTLGTVSATNMALQTNNTERMRITSAGNIGIGTTSPLGGFHVANSSQNFFTANAAFAPQMLMWSQTNDATSGYYILQKSRGGTANVAIGDNLGYFLFRGYDTSGTVRNSSAIYAVVSNVSSTVVDSDINIMASGTTSRLIMGTNFSERMRIDANGNVGIGTTTPAIKLDIVGTSNQFRVSTGAANSYYGFDCAAGSCTFKDFTDASESISLNNSGFINFAVASAERMRITSDGRVGIGTTSPTYPLTVSKNGYQGFEVSVDGTADAPVLISYNRANGAYSRVTVAAANIYFLTGTALASERMVIDSSGNVGIGTTSPGTYGKLVAVGADDNNTLVASGATNLIRMKGYLSSAAASVIEATNSIQSVYTPLFLNGSILQLGSGGAERMRIDSSGNVGIGKAPGYALDVNGQVNCSSVLVNGLPAGKVLVSSSSMSGGSYGYTGFTSAYKFYEVYFYNMVPATGDVSLYWRVHSGGAYQTASYYTESYYNDNGGSGGTSQLNTAQAFMSGPTGQIKADSNHGIYGYMLFSDPTSTSFYKTVKWWSWCGSAYNSNPMNINGMTTWRGAANGVTGFQLYFTSGNITTGQVRIYGFN